MGDDIFIFIGMVFIAVFFLVSSLVIPSFGTNARNARIIRKRAKSETHLNSNDESFKLLKKIRHKDESAFEKYFNKFAFADRLNIMLMHAGLDVPAYKYIVKFLFVSVLLFAIIYSIFNNFLYSSIAFVLPIILSYVNIKQKINKRLNEFEQQLPDALNIIARAMRAGHPFNSSLKLIAEEMSDPIAKEFNIVASDVSYGVEVRVALLDLVRRVPSVSLETVVTAVLIQRETGGNLAEILDKVAAVVRGRFRFARKVKTLSAEGRMSAWVLTCVPFVLAGVISIIEPTYLPNMITEPFGRKLILVGFGAMIIGMFWMKKIIRIEV